MISAPNEAISLPQNGAETMLDISNTFSPPIAVGEVFSDEFISIWPSVQISQDRYAVIHNGRIGGMPSLCFTERSWSELPSVNHGTRGSREGNNTVACPGAVT